MRLIVHQNLRLWKGHQLFEHGALHTDMWKTDGLKQAIDKHGFDAAFGGARRDEEISRAKERVFFSFIATPMGPSGARPELWSLYNARIDAERASVFFCLIGQN